MDVAIVGAGIAGLSLAWHLRRAGLNVGIYERNARPLGASVRNFGMIWPVGQPPAVEPLALRSAELWEEAASEFGFWFERRGSLTLAYEEAELQVLREYAAKATHGRRMIDPSEVAAKTSVRQSGLLGALWSPTECAVDPREVASKMGSHLSVHYNVPIAHYEPGQLRLSDGARLEAESIVLCPGPDLFDLIPGVGADLVRVRLNMMRLVPREPTSRLRVHLCAGLTLGHYANFAECPGMTEVKRLHARKWPAQVAEGIHVLVAERPDGSLTVGDSHEYGRDVTPYRRDEVDEAILDALNEFLPIERYRVAERWEGWYNTSAKRPYLAERIDERVWAVNLFGTGMTLSFGVAEQLAQEILA